MVTIWMTFVLYNFFSEEAMVNLLWQFLHIASVVLWQAVTEMWIDRQMKTSAWQNLLHNWERRKLGERKATVASPISSTIADCGLDPFFPNQITFRMDPTLACSRHGKMINSYYHCHGNWKNGCFGGARSIGEEKQRPRLFLLFDICCLTYKIVLSWRKLVSQD